jgi:hypothetical protein
MPNVERHCTYGQALTYLQDYCDFFAAGDMEKILGGNMLSLFHTAPPDDPDPVQ